MKRCRLSVINKFDYVQVEGALDSPALPLLIFRKGMKSSANTLALVDTGLDEGLLISKEVRDIVFVEGGPPDTHESLWAGVVDPMRSLQRFSQNTRKMAEIKSLCSYL